MDNNPTASFPASIDAVLVINLDRRQDRWEAFQQQTSSIIPKEKLHRIPAVAGVDLPGYGTRPWFRGRKRDATWAARGGCVLSHRHALETARDGGWQNVLILEDDALFGSDFQTIALELDRALREEMPSWEVCYFGYTDPWPPYRQIRQLDSTHSLMQVFGCNTAHAYLVKPPARDWMLTHLPPPETIWNWLSRHRAVDRWYLRNLGRRFGVVCISPSVVNQAPGYSDIVKRATDYAGTDAHLTAVPKSRPTIISHFPLQKKIRSLRLILNGGYDVLRGLLRRAKGF